MASNNVSIRIKTVLGGVSSGITSARQKLNGLSKSVNSSYGSWYNNIRKVNQAQVNLNKDLNRSNKAMSGMGKGLGSSLSFMGGIAGIYAVSNVMGKTTQSALDMIETQNLFNVSLGDTATEASIAVDKMSDLYGFDVTNLKNVVGTYALLARSMGMTSDQAELLSLNTTKLATDLSSLMNVPIEQVMADLRSGLVGQSETVYKYGIDVTEASLKTEAMAQGITKSVRNMSQGEKMALRYAVMLRQTTLAQGDFARTLNSPANQLKILNERFVTLSRAVGTIFIPLLEALLPYLNTLVAILIDVANAVAKVFGYVAPKTQNVADNLGNVTQEANNAGDAIGGIGKALKNATLGMDELNVMQQQTGAGGGTGGNIDDILEKMKMPSIQGWVEGINETTDKLKTQLIPYLKSTLFWVNLIGVSMLAWKIAPSVLDFFTGGGLSKIQTVGKALKGIFIPSGKTVKLTSLFGDKVAYASMSGVLLAIAGTIVIIVLRFQELIAKSESFRKGLQVLNDVGNKVFVGIGKVMSDISLALFGVDTAIGDIGISALGFGLLFTPGAPFGIALLAFEAITLAVRGIGEAFSPAIKKVDLFGTTVSDQTKQKVEPFIGKINDFQKTIKQTDWSDIEITEEIANDIKTKLADISNTIIAELDADKNQDLANLEPLRKAFSPEKFAEYTQAIEDYYSNAKEQVKANEDEINKINATALAEKRARTDEENARIYELNQKNLDLGIKQLSGNAVEYETITRNLKKNVGAISLEQATEILKNSRDTRDTTIADAETQYSEILLSAQKMKEAGDYTQEQYYAIVSEAQNTRDETIRLANEQYDGILSETKTSLGDLSKYLDEKELSIKTNWDLFWEGLKKGAGEELDAMKSYWQTSLDDIEESFNQWQPILQKGWDDFFNGLKGSFRTYGNVLISISEGIVNGLIDGLNWAGNKLNSLIEKYNKNNTLFGDKDITFRFNTMDKITLPRYANGGFVNAGQIFQAGEMGKAEMIGSYNGRTTVMPLENTDFVDAMYNAVRDAMSSVDMSKQVIENVVNLDGQVIYTNQQKIANSRGVNLGMGVFAR